MCIRDRAESARLDESLAPLSERLSDLYYGARELATDLADRLDGYDFDPGELDQIEERLDQMCIRDRCTVDAVAPTQGNPKKEQTDEST